MCLFLATLSLDVWMTPLTRECIHKFFHTLDLETGRFIVHGLRTVLFSTLNSSNIRPPLAIPNFQFRAAILQIGGNDITESGCPLELACKLEDLAGWLKIEYNIPVILICDIFTRPIPRGVSPVTYESKWCDTMQYLNNLIDVCPQELEVRSLYHLYSLKTKSSRCHYVVMTRSETKLSVAIPAPVSVQSAVNVATATSKCSITFSSTL